MSTFLPNQSNEPGPVQPSKADLPGLIEMLDLSDLQKHFMYSRWLDQIEWMADKAKTAKKWYTILRLTTIIGGVLVPILVSINFNNQKTEEAVRWITITLSGVVAVSSAVDEFFHHGERWHHYRRTVESLKIQGWQYSQLSGVYRGSESHKQAFPVFVTQVEDILQRDVEVYMTQVVQEKKEDKENEHLENQ